MQPEGGLEDFNCGDRFIAIGQGMSSPSRYGAQPDPPSLTEVFRVVRVTSIHAREQLRTSKTTSDTYDTQRTDCHLLPRPTHYPSHLLNEYQSHPSREPLIDGGMTRPRGRGRGAISSIRDVLERTSLYRNSSLRYEKLCSQLHGCRIASLLLDSLTPSR
jgi:hypothetical protein